MNKHNKLQSALTICSWLVFSGCLGSHTTKAQCKSDIEEFNIHGPLDSMRYYEYSAEGDMLYFLTLRFDENGQERSRTSFWASDQFQPSQTVYEFNDMGLKVKEYRFDALGKLEYYLKFNYDTQGYLLNDSLFVSDGRLWNFSSYEYDSLCNEVDFKYHYEDGGIWFWYSYSYGFGKKESMYDHIESMTYEYYYDEFGNCSSIKDVVNEEESKWEYTYDGKNNWTSRLQIDSGELERREYFYADQ